MKSYKSHQKSDLNKVHPIYREKGIYRTNTLNSAKKDMPLESYHFFCATVDTMLEKWALLYDIAMESPEAFNRLKAQYNTKKLFAELEKIVMNDSADKLKFAYVEAKKFIMYAEDIYPQEYNFSTKILSLALGFAVCINEAIDKKIQLQEANKKWERAYFSSQISDYIDCKEPPKKRLKKADEKETIAASEEKKSVSFGFS